MEKSCIDFYIDIKENRDIRILQISDIQPVDPGQKRFPNRISASEPLSEADLYRDAYRYIEEGVKAFTPDLILITGDIVYGEFDDSGRNLLSFISFMESLNIPYAPVFGNHDNESQKGVSWQCAQFEAANHCLFRRRELTGNGNYNIGVFRRDKLQRVIYMVDDNGCSNAFIDGYSKNIPPYNQGEKIKTTFGFGEDQLAWLEENSREIEAAYGKVPKFICHHAPTEKIAEALLAKGYIEDIETGNRTELSLNQNGDFGDKEEGYACFVQPEFWQTLKKIDADGEFVGHAHNNSLSITYEGIRITHGLKTSTYDYHEWLGTTQISVGENGSFSVRHRYSEL